MGLTDDSVSSPLTLFPPNTGHLELCTQNTVIFFFNSLLSLYLAGNLFVVFIYKSQFLVTSLKKVRPISSYTLKSIFLIFTDIL